MKKQILIMFAIAILALLIVMLTTSHAQITSLIWERLVEFGAPMIAVAIAILGLSLIALAIRIRTGGHTPLEPVAFLTEVFHKILGNKRELLNVACRLRDGNLFARSPVSVFAHNGKGERYDLDREHGVFFGCDPAHVEIGAPLTVWVGRIKFEISVEWDDIKEVPYVVIPHTREDLIALISKPPSLTIAQKVGSSL